MMKSINRLTKSNSFIRYKTMGMFDNIKCEVPLPINKKLSKVFGEKDWTKVSFQTKDMDCTLSHYIIRKNKSLVIEVRNEKWVEKEKEKGIKAFIKSLNKNKRWESPYEIITGKTTYKKVKHTGIINFYALEEDLNEDTWDLEFDAKFVDGQLISIKFKKGTIWETSEETKKKNKEINEMIMKSYHSPYNKFRKFINKVTFGYWRWGWFKVARLFAIVGNNISKVSQIIIKYT